MNLDLEETPLESNKPSVDDVEDPQKN